MFKRSTRFAATRDFRRFGNSRKPESMVKFFLSRLRYSRLVFSLFCELIEIAVVAWKVMACMSQLETPILRYTAVQLPTYLIY